MLQAFGDGVEQKAAILFGLIATFLLCLAEASLLDVELLAAGLQLCAQG